MFESIIHIPAGPRAYTVMPKICIAYYKGNERKYFNTHFSSDNMGQSKIRILNIGGPEF